MVVTDALSRDIMDTDVTLCRRCLEEVHSVLEYSELIKGGECLRPRKYMLIKRECTARIVPGLSGKTASRTRTGLVQVICGKRRESYGSDRIASESDAEGA
jgi:hypothetical protein